MKLLIYGAGTIGLTYGWMLSAKHDVSILVRPDHYEKALNGYSLDLLDLRGKRHLQKTYHYNPSVVTDIEKDYDAILVTVNRCQLKDVLPILKNKKGKALLIFLQNNWDILSEVNTYFTLEEYILGFPFQVGGGREENHIEATIFDSNTLLGETDGSLSERLLLLKVEFERAGLNIELKKDMSDWLKVHYIQQSLSAGAILKAGSYDLFASNYKAVREMVFAYREGLKVCEAYGINTIKIFPAKMFYYPAWLVASAMKNMFNQKTTRAMVKGHIKQGLGEWIAGYYEILECGENRKIDMPVWKSYKSYVDSYEHNRLDAV